MKASKKTRFLCWLLGHKILHVLKTIIGHGIREEYHVECSRCGVKLHYDWKTNTYAA